MVLRHLWQIPSDSAGGGWCSAVLQLCSLSAYYIVCVCCCDSCYATRFLPTTHTHLLRGTDSIDCSLGFVPSPSLLLCCYTNLLPYLLVLCVIAHCYLLTTYSYHWCGRMVSTFAPHYLHTYSLPDVPFLHTFCLVEKKKEKRKEEAFYAVPAYHAMVFSGISLYCCHTHLCPSMEKELHTCLRHFYLLGRQELHTLADTCHACPPTIQCGVMCVF